VVSRQFEPTDQRIAGPKGTPFARRKATHLTK
jgi:hypothetical protein